MMKSTFKRVLFAAIAANLALASSAFAGRISSSSTNTTITSPDINITDPNSNINTDTSIDTNIDTNKDTTIDSGINSNIDSNIDTTIDPNINPSIDPGAKTHQLPPQSQFGQDNAEYHRNLKPGQEKKNPKDDPIIRY